jgi:hypothetical protein
VIGGERGKESHVFTKGVDRRDRNRWGYILTGPMYRMD